MKLPKVAIVVPRRAHEWRDAVWAFLRPKWETLPWEIHEGHDESERPFNRARCINEAAAAAGDWDVLLIIDSDVYIPHAQINAAVELAHDTGNMAVAFDERYALARAATARVMTGKVPVDRWTRLPLEVNCRFPRPWHEERGYAFPHRKLSNHNSNSHCVAVPRSLWERMQGMDERFEGWGFEDMAFLACALTFAGEPERVPGYAIHFYHPRAAEREWTHSNYGVNEAYGWLYFHAQGDEAAIDELIGGRSRAVIRPINGYEAMSKQEATGAFAAFAEEPPFETDDWFRYHHLRAVVNRGMKVK